MRSILLLLVASCVFAVDHTNGVRVTIGIDPSGGSTQNIYLDQFSGSNWLVGNDGNVPQPCRYLFGSGLNVSAADGNGNRTISASAGSVSRSFAVSTRAIGTSFQISATRDASVSYGVDISITSLIATTSGAVSLKYADDSAITTNVITVMTGRSSLGGVLNIANTSTVTLVGKIPAGKYVILSSASTGSPTYSTPSGQEVLE